MNAEPLGNRPTQGQADDMCRRNTAQIEDSEHGSGEFADRVRTGRRESGPGGGQHGRDIPAVAGVFVGDHPKLRAQGPHLAGPHPAGGAD